MKGILFPSCSMKSMNVEEIAKGFRRMRNDKKSRDISAPAPRELKARNIVQRKYIFGIFFSIFRPGTVGPSLLVIFTSPGLTHLVQTSTSLVIRDLGWQIARGIFKFSGGSRRYEPSTARTTAN